LRGLLKTLYFNFHYLPFNQAIRLPLIVSHRVWLKKTGGRVVIRSKVLPGMIWIGFGEVGIFDEVRSRSVWEVRGTVVFEGLARIGHGSKITVYSEGKLVLGNKFSITAESSIVCKRSITFGEDCLLSWDILVMDTDIHRINDSAGRHLNPDGEIVIGNHVWICCRCTVLKGSVVGNNSVVGAGSFLSKSVKEENVLIAGHPAKVLQHGISWEH
jgi:acetyltransferase-like isoleucine patch superfamily enzyme